MLVEGAAVAVGSLGGRRAYRTEGDREREGKRTEGSRGRERSGNEGDDDDDVYIYIFFNLGKITIYYPKVYS